MLVAHLSMLPWSGFISLTSGSCNPNTGAWHYVPRSNPWWCKSTAGFLRGLARQHGLSIKELRYVRRLERSEQNDLLHCHILVWTGRPWTLTDAFRANSLWKLRDNGTKHCTPYDMRQAGVSYVLKGLHFGDSVTAGLHYEFLKTEQLGSSFPGCLTIDHNTSMAVQAMVNRGGAFQKSPVLVTDRRGKRLDTIGYGSGDDFLGRRRLSGNLRGVIPLL
jgi:hypothetical protein